MKRADGFSGLLEDFVLLTGDLKGFVVAYLGQAVDLFLTLSFRCREERIK